ncbi:hypothetical protein BOKEGFJH_00223 [Chlamydia avium]|uniref:Uncharacterized protein n=2 Tax=Chlamydia avium TaxID=1457141 RepID=W8JLC1_9CHLA|nr:Uncharacterized protein M832_02320 [Chlamydia avium 10DC88]VVT42712.1 hypothetical protein BOKEGFJH_00223 [Chlamydia avium]
MTMIVNQSSLREITAPPVEKTSSTISLKRRVVHIAIVIFMSLTTISFVLASVLSGILPLLSIGLLSLLILSIIAIKQFPHPKKSIEIDESPASTTELLSLLVTDETTPHTQILEKYADLITDNWTSLPNILEDSSTAFLQKVWKFNHSKTVLFSTTGSVYTPRIQCCCNLMIALENNENTFANLDILNIVYDRPEHLTEGQCLFLPWKNYDGSTNKHRLGLPNFLGFIQTPDASFHKNNPFLAYSFAKSSYTRCLEQAITLGVDMVQLPLISISPLQTSQEALTWKSAIQTGLVAAIAQFAVMHPGVSMNIVVVSPPGLGLPI